MKLVEITFWVCSAGVVYTYALYPVLLTLAARLMRHRPDAAASDPAVDAAGEDLPFVSLVIAAYREEAVILQRLNNALLTDYPADRFEIVIGVDGNEDLTGELVSHINDPRIRLRQFPVRRGKPSVLNDCIPDAKGDIVVLSDANTDLHPQAIRRLVAHFKDPSVGGVVGQLVLVDSQTGLNNDGLYWQYENYLKHQEGRLGALLGANGAIYAIRRERFAPIPPNTIVDDLLIGMQVHLRGERLVFESEAVATEETATSIADEFGRRARIGAGAFQSLIWLYPLLNPLRGRIAFTFWSHKVLRWVCPLLLIGALVSNLILCSHPFYWVMLSCQIGFYAMAVLGLTATKDKSVSRFSRVAGLFVGVNAALLVGLQRFLRNSQGSCWKRTDRSVESSVEQIERAESENETEVVSS